MNQHHWSDHRVVVSERRPAVSRRERAALRRKQRARTHLERMRGAPRTRALGTPVANLLTATGLALLVPLALATSVAVGAIVGGPLVAAAHGWITGKPAQLGAISVSGAARLTLLEIARATGLEPATPLGKVDPLEVERRLAAHPWIAAASAVQLPTGRLLIRIEERVARARVQIGVSGETFAVDASGMPFAAVAPEDLAELPRLAASEGVVAQQTNDRLASGIALAYQLPEYGLPLPAELSIAAEDDPEGFALRLPNLTPRVVLGREELDARLAQLARLLDAGLPEVLGAESLDLRFADQAVLRGAPASKGSAQAAAVRGRATSSMARPAG